MFENEGSYYHDRIGNSSININHFLYLNKKPLDFLFALIQPYLHTYIHYLGMNQYFGSGSEY